MASTLVKFNLLPRTSSSIHWASDPCLWTMTQQQPQCCIKCLHALIWHLRRWNIGKISSTFREGTIFLGDGHPTFTWESFLWVFQSLYFQVDDHPLFFGKQWKFRPQHKCPWLPWENMMILPSISTLRAEVFQRLWPEVLQKGHAACFMEPGWKRHAGTQHDSFCPKMSLKPWTRISPTSWWSVFSCFWKRNICLAEILTTLGKTQLASMKYAFPCSWII